MTSGNGPGVGVAVDADRAPDLRGPVRFLLWMARCQGRRVLRGATFASLWMVGLALPPWLLSRAVEGFRAGDPLSRLALWALALLGAGVVTGWLSISRHRTMSTIRIEGNFRVSRLVVRQATRFGVGLDRRLGAGELATLGLSDVMGASTSLTVTGPGVGAVVACAVIGVLVWRVSALLAVTVLVGIPVLAVVVGPLVRRLIASHEGYRTEQGVLSSQLVDAVSGLRVLRAFGGTARYRSRYAETSGRVRDRGYDVARTVSWIDAVAAGLPALFLAGVVWLAARMAFDGTITAGDLVAVYGWTAVLVVPVNQFVEGADQVGRGVVAARRITAFLAADPGAPTAAPGVAPEWGAVLADPRSGVGVRPHQLVGLACGSARDASEIVERLGGLRLGQVAWGAVGLADCDPREVRRRVLVAEPDAALFAGTVREVVCGARTGATDDEVRAALGVAAAADVVTAAGGGLDGRVDPGGTSLSGGQRQRLRLARAVLQRPEVLLAVEPTAALDAHTEAVVAERLRRDRRGRQTLVATTSPLVLSQVDVVLLVERGRVVARGTHAEVLADPRYRRLVSRGGDPVPAGSP